MIIDKTNIQPSKIVTYELPNQLNPKNVIYYSEHFKQLQNTTYKDGRFIEEKTINSIRTKAKIFLKKGLIAYDPEETKYGESTKYDGHRFICKPIEGYNKTTYRLWWDNERKDFECSCQFNQTYKIGCSHSLALWMQIKIWNYNRK